MVVFRVATVSRSPCLSGFSLLRIEVCVVHWTHSFEHTAQKRALEGRRLCDDTHDLLRPHPCDCAPESCGLLCGYCWHVEEFQAAQSLLCPCVQPHPWLRHRRSVMSISLVCLKMGRRKVRAREASHSRLEPHLCRRWEVYRPSRGTVVRSDKVGSCSGQAVRSPGSSLDVVSVPLLCHWSTSSETLEVVGIALASQR